MPDAISPTASSLTALTQSYQVITQNLANASTVGYKKAEAVFAQTLAARMASAASGDTSGATEITPTFGVDFGQGRLVSTGNPLDVAITGPAFFTVETPRGPLYTRNGSLAVNTQGQLVDQAGRLVSGTSGPIVIPPNCSPADIRVASDGTVSAGNQQVGQLRMVEFKNPSLLTPAGGSCYSAPPAARPDDVTKGSTVAQGFQESSNVSVVEELVKLITVSRLYEANMKNIQTQDDKLKSLLGVAMR